MNVAIGVGDTVLGSEIGKHRRLSTTIFLRAILLLRENSYNSTTWFQVLHCSSVPLQSWACYFLALADTGPPSPRLWERRMEGGITGVVENKITRISQLLGEAIPIGWDVDSFIFLFQVPFCFRCFFFCFFFFLRGGHAVRVRWARFFPPLLFCPFAFFFYRGRFSNVKGKGLDLVYLEVGLL